MEIDYVYKHIEALQKENECLLAIIANLSRGEDELIEIEATQNLFYANDS